MRAKHGFQISADKLTLSATTTPSLLLFFNMCRVS
jgi:hypothetical protein